MLIFDLAMGTIEIKEPGLAAVFYEFCTVEYNDTYPTAATNGSVVWINPAFFESLTHLQRVSLVAHELLHVMLYHMSRGKTYRLRGFGPDNKPYSHDVHNQAADYVINAMLIAAKLGEMIPGMLVDSRFTADMLSDDVYIILNKDADADKEPEPSKGKTGIDGHVEPDNSIPEIPQDEIINTAKTAGKGGSLAVRELIERESGTGTNWHDIILPYFANNSGRTSRNYSRISRAGLIRTEKIILPTYRGGIGRIAIEIDMSGSCSDYAPQFLADCRELLEQLDPEQVIIIWTAHAVAGVDYIDDLSDWESVVPRGAGGTDMVAGFEWLIEQGEHVDTLVVMTDGATPLPSSEQCAAVADQVVWALYDTSARYTRKIDDAGIGDTIIIE